MSTKATPKNLGRSKRSQKKSMILEEAESQSQTSPSDMPPEAIELLNQVDQGVIGIDKPKVERTVDEGITYSSEFEALNDSGDYTRIDNGV